ncbi:MAG: hypothetical protein M1819_005092 [Sarea resinae]|nr:MAG: hypothetical protein M1819_005092 [Sarea resinae]
MYSSAPSQPARRKEKKMPTIREHERSWEERREKQRDPKPTRRTDDAKMAATNPPPHSKPVVIPSRNAGSVRGFPKPASHNQNARGISHRAIDVHKPSSVPPAVAALLAITSIPPPPRSNTLRRRSNYNQTQASIMALLEEPPWDDKEMSHDGRSLTLQSSPSSDSDNTTVTDDESFSRPPMSVRSISSESIPSLEGDNDSILSSFSAPATPAASIQKASPTRKSKIVSSPPTEDCVLDHPLLSAELDIETPQIDAGAAIKKLPPVVAPQTRSKSIKSNLTASFRALKSAARSLSNFTAPAIQPDDFLTRSILSFAPEFTDERRPPLPLAETPTPALRRYWNPSNAGLREQQWRTTDRDRDPCTAMIQLQTYQRPVRASKKGSSSPASGRTPLKGEEEIFNPIARQREPRENSDFLRMIVLEMNMRREGKLSEKAVGRARVWLPARQPCKKSATEDGVPARWIGVVVE